MILQNWMKNTYLGTTITELGTDQMTKKNKRLYRALEYQGNGKVWDNPHQRLLGVFKSILGGI